MSSCLDETTKHLTPRKLNCKIAIPHHFIIINSIIVIFLRIHEVINTCRIEKKPINIIVHNFLRLLLFLYLYLHNFYIYYIIICYIHHSVSKLCQQIGSKLAQKLATNLVSFVFALSLCFADRTCWHDVTADCCQIPSKACWHNLSTDWRQKSSRICATQSDRR